MDQNFMVMGTRQICNFGLNLSGIAPYSIFVGQ